jgi:hypothetical protein
MPRKHPADSDADPLPTAGAGVDEVDHAVSVLTLPFFIEGTPTFSNGIVRHYANLPRP